MHQHTALLIAAGLVFLVTGGGVTIAGRVHTGRFCGGSQRACPAFIGAMAAVLIGVVLLALALIGM